MISIFMFVIALILIIAFAIVLVTAKSSLSDVIIRVKKEQQAEIIKTKSIELNILVDLMKKRRDLSDKANIKKGKKLKQEIDEAQKKLNSLEKGHLSIIEIVPIAGYHTIQMLGWDATNEVVKKLYKKCEQFKEKNEAMNYTYYVLASLFGYVMLAMIVLFIMLGLMLMTNFGLIIKLVIPIALFLVVAILGYIPYDDVNNIVANRAEQIDNQFPQVVSKMTLLTVAGMEVSQAWNLASQSGRGTLYEEMNRVNIDLANNVAPQVAYQKFMTRCNNNYTTKLATAIIQNLSKGNSEIVTLFKTLNNEAWLEYKHSARRMGEKISAKLMLPTMLLFAGIILLIIVPVCTGFSL